MQKGDLSNSVAPRHVVVFEGGIATLPLVNASDFDKAMKRKRYWEAINFWEWNPHVLGQIERVVRTMGVNIEVCTWIKSDEYAGFAMAIADELDKINIPVRSVWESSPNELARALAYINDIACIYDPDPAHVLTFGKRGVYLTSPNQIGRG